jgi:tetratricopeptide (TPR) repeat protein
MKQLNASKLAVSGMEFIDKREFDAAICDFREAQELYQELGANENASNMMSMQGICFYALGRWDEAVAVLREALVLKRDLGDTEGEASDLLGLGEVYLRAGDGKSAEEAFARALCISHSEGLKDCAQKAEKGMERARALPALG